MEENYVLSSKVIQKHARSVVLFFRTLSADKLRYFSLPYQGQSEVFFICTGRHNCNLTIVEPKEYMCIITEKEVWC